MITYRNEAVGTAAGIHALLIGISDYPYLPGGDRAHEGNDYDLGMEQLASPAISAFKLARWLLQGGPERLTRPLASLRLVIAPSAAERERIGQIQDETDLLREALARCEAGTADDCSFDSVSAALQAWREDCAANNQNAAWFYFAGHGLQLIPRQPVMLLSGYNRRHRAVLDEAVAFQDVFDGMEVTVDFPKMALQQHFVVDACRSDFQAIRELLHPTLRQPWSYKGASGHKARSFATIFGTASGRQSFGSTEGAILAQGLLRALEGEAADAELDDASKRIWTVKQYRLLQALGMLVDQIAKDLGVTQAIEPGPMNADLLWSNIADTPILPVSIELSPEAAHPPERLVVQPEHSGGKPTLVDVTAHPYSVKLEAGLYSASVRFPERHPFRSCVSDYPLCARPPWSQWRIPVPIVSEPSAGGH
ncbi:MAG: caspase family protein [Aureliella sp.]